ncbi:MAG: hypothetical protein Q7T11_00720 [Deltaproteobacteria bacterium]|nr:hypothetical protein [Deltaproteobacteria bacterium]
MLERYCDALIIGTDISGLITASFLARRGLSVHVLDPEPFTGNLKEPDPFCVAHLHSKLLRSILGRLNIPETDIQGLSAADSPLQIIFQKKRIDISANPVTFYEELEREFPDQHEKLKLFYENLAYIKHQMEAQQLYSLLLPSTFREKRQLMKFVRSHGLDRRLDSLGLPTEENPDLKSFITAQLNLITHSHVDSPFAFQVAELLNPSEGEILSVQGGHQYLKKLFIERIIHHEGAYRPEAKIEKLLFRNGSFEGAELAGFEGNILARYIIWNTQLKRLVDYLPKMLRFYWLKKSIRNLKPAAHWFSSHFELPSALNPPPMRDNFIVIDDVKKELSGTNFLYVQVKDREKEMARFSVSYLLGPEALEAGEEFFAPIQEALRAKLAYLLPFSEEKLAHRFPLPPQKQEEGTLFPLKENDFEILKQTARSHPIYRLKASSFTHLFPVGYKTAAANFFLTSPEILGSLGYEGKFMLGLKVTDLIWKDVEKGKKRAMKQERRIA